MDGDRWERIKELFEAVRERDEPERSLFLAQACPGDEELRREVESLLSGEKKAGDFLQAPAVRLPLIGPANDQSPSTFSPGETISGRFKVLRFIGRGGMGEVYEARDLDRGVRVALKTIRPEIASDPKTLARFKQEIELALRVAHPNVCRVHDLERHRPPEGVGKPEVVFLTMELLEGETLARRLRRQGKMTCEEALPLVRQLADGLAAAHKVGVIHCDFKPGNVMLVAERPGDIDSQQTTQSEDRVETGSGGTVAGAPLRAVITDFGLARAMRPRVRRETIQESLNADRHLVGTLPYMAPEQLEGCSASPASDVYALGLVAYEVVTGHQPFSGSTPLAAYKRLKEPPPSPRSLAPDVDPALESIILRCLQTKPGARYESAGDVLRALGQGSGQSAITEWLTRRRLWIGVAVALTALLLSVPRLIHREGAKPHAEGENLVVLPFTAVGGRPEEVAYCDGFTVTVTTQLAQVRSLAVVPAFEVHDMHVTTVAGARAQLGATLVLLPTWQRLGDKIQITLALIDTSTNHQLQGRTVDHDANDLFTLQNQVVEAAVGMLDVQPSAAMAKRGQPAPQPGATVQPAAYDYYIQGRGYLQDYQNLKSIESAVAVFSEALKLQPDYAPAHAGLGDANWNRYKLTSDRQWLAPALTECKRALALDANLSAAHTCLGTLYNGTGQYETAVPELVDALTLDPSSDQAYRELAAAYEKLGNLAAAERTYQRAISVRPSSWAGYNKLGNFYFGQNRFDEASQMFAQVIALAPDNEVGYSNQGAVDYSLGRYQQAIEMFKRSVAIRPNPDAYSNIATCYYQLREFEEAVRYDQLAIKLNQNDYLLWGALADAYYEAPGKRNDAATAYKRAIALAQDNLAVNRHDSAVLGNVADYYAMVDDRSSALKFLREALGAAPNDSSIEFQAGEVYNQLGDKQEALTWLKKALAHGYSASTVKNTPFLDNLRGDPDFRALFTPSQQ